MKALANIGKFIYAIPFILFGVFHFMDAQSMTGMLSGFPNVAALILVYVSGAALILAGVSIIMNKMAKTACLLLALLLLLIILVIHMPNMGNQMTMPSLLKDIALLGAALTYSGILKN